MEAPELSSIVINGAFPFPDQTISPHSDVFLDFLRGRHITRLELNKSNFSEEDLLELLQAAVSLQTLLLSDLHLSSEFWTAFRQKRILPNLTQLRVESNDGETEDLKIQLGIVDMALERCLRLHIPVDPAFRGGFVTSLRTLQLDKPHQGDEAFEVKTQTLRERGVKLEWIGVRKTRCEKQMNDY